MVPPLYGRLIARWRHGRCRDAKLWSEMRVGFWMWEYLSHRRWRADQLGSEGRCKRPSGVRGGASEQKYVSKMKKNITLIWKICWSQVLRPVNVFRYIQTVVVTEDFPIVQAFWWNIVFNPWTHGFFTSSITLSILYFTSGLRFRLFWLL